MARGYTASHKISALSAAKTLMYLTTPADLIAIIHGCSVSNADIETNEQIEVVLQRITSLGTPTATTIVPAPTDPGDVAASVTVKADVTASEPTYGAAGVGEFGAEGAPSIGAWRFEPLLESERIIVSPATSIGLRILAAPTAFAARIKLNFEEVGG